MSAGAPGGRVVPVPCLLDNYAYLLCDREAGTCAVVDPSECDPVLAALEREGLTLRAVLCTHHHADHVGGVEALLAHCGESIPVYGHASETARIPRLSRGLAHGDEFACVGARVVALHVPAHTSGALAFACAFDSDPAGAPSVLFTGDTLFVSGCGRLFEGTAAMMHRALNEVLASLADACAVYPGHEYAEKNLRFAEQVEPENAAVIARLAAVREARARDAFCVPSTLATERACNPFLRVREPAVREFARARGADAGDAVSVLAALRAARDRF